MPTPRLIAWIRFHESRRRIATFVWSRRAPIVERQLRQMRQTAP